MSKNERISEKKLLKMIETARDSAIDVYHKLILAQEFKVTHFKEVGETEKLIHAELREQSYKKELRTLESITTFFESLRESPDKYPGIKLHDFAMTYCEYMQMISIYAIGAASGMGSEKVRPFWERVEKDELKLLEMIQGTAYNTLNKTKESHGANII